MELVSRLFGEAWAYRRRRHRAVGAGVLLAVAAVAAGLAVGHGSSAPGSGSYGGAYRFEPARSVIAESSIAVGGDGPFQRVTVSVELNSQATSVVAFVDGRGAHLRPLSADAGPSVGFAGGLKLPSELAPAAGVPGAHGGSVIVRLRITYPDGSRVGTAIGAHFKHGLVLR